MFSKWLFVVTVFCAATLTEARYFRMAPERNDRHDWSNYVSNEYYYVPNYQYDEGTDQPMEADPNHIREILIKWLFNRHHSTYDTNEKKEHSTDVSSTIYDGARGKKWDKLDNTSGQSVAFGVGK